MKRREFVMLGGGAMAASPLAARAQQTNRVRRIAVLVGGVESDQEQVLRLSAFRDALRELGWTEGRNLTIDARYTAGEATRTRALARELIERSPDAILAATTPVVAELRQQAPTIPIVFVVVSDPVGSGFVASLPRPGGNVTGFINLEASLGGKWVELLREIAPGLTRAAMMFNPETAPQSDYYLPPFESAARAFAVEPIVARVRGDGEVEEAMAALGRAPGSGLIVMPDFFLSARRTLIISLADRHCVPAIYPFRFFAVDGGLASYGIDLVDSYRRAASYVDRILKGAKPADLPVQQPTRFEMVVNLKAAKALGLAIPESLLARADEVIE